MGGRDPVTAVGQQPCQRVEPGRPVQLGGAQLHIQPAAHLGDQLDRPDRVAAGREEARRPVRGRAAQNVSPGQPQLCGHIRRVGVLLGVHARPGPRLVEQRRLIDLAAGRQRELVQHGDPRGHHVVGQGLRELPHEHRFGILVGRAAAVEPDERGQQAAAGAVERHDHRVEHEVDGQQPGDDLTGFHPEAAVHLDLGIEAAVQLVAAVGPGGGHVAGAIGPLAVEQTERGGRRGPPQVATAHRDALDDQLGRVPLGADRCQPEPDPVHRRTDRDGVAGQQVPVADDDGRLGRAVAVDHAGAARRGVRPGGDGALGRRLAAGHHQPKIRRELAVRTGQFGAEAVEHARRQAQHGDPEPAAVVQEVLGAAVHERLVPEGEFTAGHHGGADLFEREVEGDRGEEQSGIGRGQSVPLDGAPDVVLQGGLLDDGALGHAGRPRGVADVRGGRGAPDQPFVQRRTRLGAARQPGLRDQRGRAAVVNDQLLTGVRQLRLQQGEGRAGPADRGHRDDGVEADRQVDDDHALRRHTGLVQPRGQGVHGRGEFAVAQPVVAAGQGGLLGTVARLRGDRGVQHAAGFRSHQAFTFRERGVTEVLVGVAGRITRTVSAATAATAAPVIQAASRPELSPSANHAAACRDPWASRS